MAALSVSSVCSLFARTTLRGLKWTRSIHDMKLKTHSDSYKIGSLTMDDFGQTGSMPFADECVDQRGMDTPIVILGGTAQTINTFTMHIKPIAKVNRVIVLELRGQGSNGLRSERARMHQHVKDVHTALSMLGVQSAYLCGFSFGGRVALAYAAHYPEVVKKLSLTGVCHTRPKVGEMIIKSWEDALRRGNIRECAWSFILNGYSSAFIEKHYSKLSGFMEMVIAANKPEKLYDLIRLSHSADDTDAPFAIPACAPKVHCPTQIIAATNDRIAGYEASLALASHIESCSSIVSLETGHLAPFEQPLQWRKAVIDFFLQSK